MPADEVRVGDHVRVRPGEKVPLDGRVVSGESDVNQAPITGESLPVDKRHGDEVFAGSINGHGALEIVTTTLRRDTTLARIIHLVETAQAERAPAQTFVDRFARIYTPAVMALAALVAVVPPLARLGRRGLMALPRARAARDRVPVRARDLDARGDRVRAGRRRPARRAHQGRRAPGAARGRAQPRVRQDGHAHARDTRRSSTWSPSTACRPRRCCDSRRR